jgi:hypothetical protein
MIKHMKVVFAFRFASVARFSAAAVALIALVAIVPATGCKKKQIAPVIAAPDTEEIADLISALKTKKRVGFIADYRISAAGRLGDAGPAAKDAIPALEKLAQDKDPEVKAAAEKALAKIKGS